MSDDDLLPISDAAKRLNISVPTLRRWADAGRIPYVRLPSGQRRFRLADIEEVRKPVPEPRPWAPGDPLPTDRQMTAEEEITFYSHIARSHLANARDFIADLKSLESAEGLPAKERAKAARSRARHENLLPKLERNDQRLRAEYERIIGRPLSDELESDGATDSGAIPDV